MKRLLLLAVVAQLLSSHLLATPANVTKVELLHQTRGGWLAKVALEHDDWNWDHCANWIEVLDGAGVRLVRRDVITPVVGEDERPPFYRVYLPELPEGTTKLVVRAHCKVDGYWGGAAVTVDLSTTSGPGYSVGAAPHRPERTQFFRGEGDFMRSWLRRWVEHPPTAPENEVEVQLKERRLRHPGA